MLVHAKSHLHILGVMCPAEVANAHKDLASVYRERPRYYPDSTEVVKCFFKEDAYRVLHRLHELEQVAGTMHEHRGCYGHNGRVGLECLYHLNKRVCLYKRVGV